MVQFGRTSFGICRVLRQMSIPGCCVAAMACFAFAGETVAERSQQVTDHLSAGEFGPAMKIAASAPDEERAQLLGQIEDAQRTSGDSDAATATRRRIPRKEKLAKGQPDDQTLGGGGPMMNIMMLTRLIQQVFQDGGWEDREKVSIQAWPLMNNTGGGVSVAPGGLMQRLSATDNEGQLAAMSLRARKADLNEEIARKSELRMVSLTRLEQAVARRLEEGLPIPASMAQLAGLYQVKYVFVYPDANEIVLAGPADGWQHNSLGQAISIEQGRPTLLLEDLVTVLRTFAKGEGGFGCSINTRDESVKALKAFVQETSGQEIDSSMTRKWLSQVQKKLGRQDVVVWGIPADSRVARVIVEADYRMKLIGIDKLDAGKSIPSYFDLLPMSQQKDPPPMDALRWWLSMQFDAVLHSVDKTVFEIQGSSVLCQSENQMLTAEGKHEPTGNAEGTNRLFAENFTKNYSQLAAKDPVFADVQNIFDLALCSALIKQEHLDAKTNWDLGVFAPNGEYSPATYPVPREIESVINHRVYRGRHIVVQVAGGVSADVMAAARSPKLNKAAPELENVANAAKAPQLPVGRWWWDAAN